MFYFLLGLTEKNLWFVPVQHPSVTDFSGHITSYFCSVPPPPFLPYWITKTDSPKEKIHWKLCILQKRNLYLNQFSNKKGAIGKPERPKKHPIWAADPRTHLSTKFPPRRFPRWFVSSERVLGLPSLIDSSKVS